MLSSLQSLFYTPESFLVRYPLNLFITSKFGSEYTQHPVIELLVEHAERWQDLYLQISVELYTVHSKAIKGRLHSLELLQIHLHHPFTAETIDIFEISPRLQTLFIFEPISVGPH